MERSRSRSRADGAGCSMAERYRSPRALPEVGGPAAVASGEDVVVVADLGGTALGPAVQPEVPRWAMVSLSAIGPRLLSAKSSSDQRVAPAHPTVRAAESASCSRREA